MLMNLSVFSSLCDGCNAENGDDSNNCEDESGVTGGNGISGLCYFGLGLNGRNIVRDIGESTLVKSNVLHTECSHIVVDVKAACNLRSSCKFSSGAVVGLEEYPRAGSILVVYVPSVTVNGYSHISIALSVERDVLLEVSKLGVGGGLYGLVTLILVPLIAITISESALPLKLP